MVSVRAGTRYDPPVKFPTSLVSRSFGAAFVAALFAVPHLVQSQTPPVARNCIEITMTGLRNANGTVAMGLYNDPARWPQPDGAAMTCRVPIVGNQATCGFENVHPGTDYAVAASHDENNNGHFDTNVLGAPLEGFAFTNDAQPLLAPPSFDECRVHYAGGIVRLRMTARY